MTVHPLRHHNLRLHIENLPPDALSPDPKAARTHSRQQLRRIARSIEEFGFGVPVLVDAEGMILAGHARVEAARMAGLLEIPTVRLAHLTPAQAKAFALAENKLAQFGEWNKRILGETLLELSLDPELDVLITGFETAEIDPLILDLNEPSLDIDPDDEPPPSGPAVTKPGDLWRILGHRVLCGDARLRASYERLLGGERVSVTFADPPYNLTARHIGGRGKITHRDFAMAAGEMSGPEFTAFLTTVCGLAAEWSLEGSIAYWCIDWRHISHLLAAGAETYDELKNICVWAKAQAGQGALYRSQHEMVAVFKKGRKAHRNNVQLGRFGRNRSNVWSYPSPSSFGHVGEEGRLLADHSTPKPVALVADAIMDVTARGELVADPFLGGGATLIAAERVGRLCRGMELDPLYVDVCLRRMRRHCGEEPVRDGDGARLCDLEAAAER